MNSIVQIQELYFKLHNVKFRQYIKISGRQEKMKKGRKVKEEKFGQDYGKIILMREKNKI